MKLNQVTTACSVETFFACLDFYQKLGLILIVHTHDAYARFECPAGETGSEPATFSLHVREGWAGCDDPLVYFEVPDVAAEVDRLKTLGIQVDGGPVAQSWLWTEARLRDPAGNALCLYHAGTARRFPPWRNAET